MIYYQRGFTLVEILLTMIIVSGVYYSVLIMVPKGKSNVEQDAWNIVKGLRYIHQVNEMTVFGLKLSKKNLRFYKFHCDGSHDIKENMNDRKKNKCTWLPIIDNGFLYAKHSGSLMSELTIYNEIVNIDNDSIDKTNPQLIFSPEDEYVDFTLILESQDRVEYIEIKSNISGIYVTNYKK